MKTYPARREEIYFQYLQDLSGIKFTLREIDIMSCILHNRGEKKIATILDISHRTVSTHTRNIMNKIGLNNSREYIIDTVEKSGKLQNIKEYYFHLIINASFERHLQKVRAVTKHSHISYTHNFDQDLTENEKIYIKDIQNYLDNVNIADANKKAKEASNYLYIINNRYKEPDISQQQNMNCIGLIFEDDVDTTLLNKNINYVDFRSCNNFYFLVFKLIEQIIQKPEIKKISDAFNKEYQSFQESWSGLNIQEEIHIPNIPIALPKKRTLKNGLLLGSVGAIIVLTFVLFPKNPPNISNINKDIAEFVTLYSADNITIKAEIEKNYSMVRKVEQVMQNFDEPHVIDYFYSNQVSQDELINCLYVIHALSTNYTYNQHDGAKALKLLNIAKNMVHNYVMNKSGVQIDFDKLTPNEIHHELQITPDLSELYAKIMYLLGNIYIYQGEFNKPIRYYQISESLGNKMNLFEYYLTKRGGTNVLRRVQAHNDILKGNKKSAEQKLLKSIDILEKLKKDKRAYKINYRPNNLKPRTIIPANDVHNRLFINEQIIKAYARLIDISDDRSKKQEYAQIIMDYFIGTDEYIGILSEIKHIVPKRKAGVCNTLGMTMIKLTKLEVDLSKLIESIITKLEFAPGNNLEIIEQIFTFSKEESRNTDCTKADAYHGLAMVYKEMLKTDKGRNTNALNSKITHMQNERDNINIKLNRNHWRFRVQDSMY